MNLGRGVPLAEPVGDHNAPIAPVLSKNIRQQEAAFHRIDAIDTVVGRHHAPGIPLLDRNLETLEVNLPQSPLRHDSIVLDTAGFLVVRREMLCGGPHAAGLYAPDHCRSTFPAEHRIFGIVLEVPAAHWIAVDVQSRSEDDVTAILQNFISHCLAASLNQF